ncbi:hypothetical protein R3I94_015018 [Phoxinus phoxinus]
MIYLRPDWTSVLKATPPFSLVEGKANLFSQSGYSFRGVADWYRASRCSWITSPSLLRPASFSSPPSHTVCLSLPTLPDS